ncbi:MAG: Excinuclease subunit [Pedosphaera sp.]|nr:Excinuclease subunit [Pedosphaera sp.]
MRRSGKRRRNKRQRVAAGEGLSLTIRVPAPQQLHLFEPAKPLLQRFGAGFFKAVPRKPGVYIMSGEADRVLYIGQSGNLRQRLGSYKNARPDRVPRKIIRLIHLVRTLVWEECETPAAARLKETQLLRVHRPKFNVQNTYPPAYRFIGLTQSEERLDFSLGREPKPEGKVYGAFKSGSVRAYAGLLRLLWAALHQPGSPHDFPATLLHTKPPKEFSLRAGPSPAQLGLDQMATSVDNYLAGESEELINLLAGALPAGPEISNFQRNLLAEDLETLTEFYEHAAKRNRNLRQQNGLEDRIIPPETLDDLLALAWKAREASD